MVRLTYDDINVDVPESWNDITLGFYETFSEDRPETTRERVALVAKICNIEADTLLSWPAEVFNEIVERISFLFKDNPTAPNPCIIIDDVTYVVPIEDELSLGAWVDAEEAQKAGENVLSNILAIVCRPVGEDYDYKNNEARRAMFAALPVSEVLGVLAFFLHCKSVYDQRTAAYSKLAQACDQLPPNIRPFQRHTGGIRLSRIWQTIKYAVLITLLKKQLRKFLRSCNTRRTRLSPKTRSRS